MPLHRDDVVRGAIDLLDEVGLDRLTTRALTTRLGVAPGALYWHIRSKAELLSAIAAEIMREAFTAPAATRGDWAEQSAAFAHRTRRAMLAHRDGARVVAGHLPFSAAALDATEAGLALLRGTGLPLARAAYFGHTVASYVTGFVLQEQAEPPVAETTEGAAGTPLPTVTPERHPHLLEWMSAKPTDREEAFTAGLDLIINGLRGELAQQ
ncbi:TetR/AcrR family transcriptional regulator C-terminal domain-containing protein [Kitasatospora sp. NBC_01287]|uniref:TetR/AcrR family transcriptional regulator C-terminal domain-containing protein n=1 Tax=Kitasatospora sp. NBC_01287 TaxID=2903573 RepID=UPI00225A2FC6|nr:TetR/AcrR family transcriptional regulator C-terminal domain-containing protein [Kitasatospora sp. NBC_01287]MCX4749991.1 TetR/AcrR family transcriptional regulator C-terminal domain-containing protein [Kitasatospora sp. NBC_01287]